MAQSFDALYAHVVFSTRQREPLLAAGWRAELWDRFGGILRGRGEVLLATGGVEDHVHLLLSYGRTVTVAEVVREVKAASSQWIHRRQTLPHFAWQQGYGVFSVSRSVCDVVAGYIASQEVHHRAMTFQDEFRMLLEKHGLEYDERYLWD